MMKSPTNTKNLVIYGDIRADMKVKQFNVVCSDIYLFISCCYVLFCFVLMT